MQNIKYPTLFSPVRIGRLEIKNRVAMTAMGVNLAAAGGGVSDDIIAFYEARARGGIGLIVSGVCRVMVRVRVHRASSQPGTGVIYRGWRAWPTRCTSTTPGSSSSCSIRAAPMVWVLSSRLLPPRWKVVSAARGHHGR